jgi:hypothetical protein
MHFLRRTLPVATVLLVGISSASAQSTASVSGHWEGKIHQPVRAKPRIRMVPSHSSLRARARRCEGLLDKELQLDARSVGGSYRGTLGADGQIAGEWTQGAIRLTLTFKRGPSGEE